MNKKRESLEYVLFEGQKVKLDDLLAELRHLREAQSPSEKELRSTLQKHRESRELKPFQAELIQIAEPSDGRASTHDHYLRRARCRRKGRHDPPA